jgi:D-ribose pyranase
MKKNGILNSDISHIVATMGHLDRLCIADAGLPIPQSSDRVDLALAKGIPSFLETLKVILEELEVQEIILAEEMLTTGDESKKLYKQIKKMVGEVTINFFSHEQFKDQLYDCRAVIRTGEFTPYANIILVSGVVF